MSMDNTQSDDKLAKIGLGGGCHWCTEGIFESLIGIHEVHQGWIASTGLNAALSEAIVVSFNPLVISLHTLIEIHLHTHASTAEHSMRQKYRSAIYTYSEAQQQDARAAVDYLQADFDKTIITQIIPFATFKPNKDELNHYLYSDPDKPFCKTYIHPKLRLLLSQFKAQVDQDKLAFLGREQ